MPSSLELTKIKHKTRNGMKNLISYKSSIQEILHKLQLNFDHEVIFQSQLQEGQTTNALLPTTHL